MSSVAFLIDFQVDRDLVSNGTSMKRELIENCLPIINKDLPDSLQFKILFEKHFQLFSFVLVANNCDHLLQITIYLNGTISLTSENCTSRINFREISDRLKSHLKVSNYQFVPLKRASFIKYMPTSDGRIMEYDCDELLFEKQSDYQLVQIYRSKTFGNLLVLEGLQNLSDSDLIYTETLMHRNVENYCDKEVLILGGGDGALLYELLKEKPKFVTMIEIDDVVVQCCSKFMRTVCGDVLDTRSAKNYEIIIDDCFNCFAKFIEKNKKFDYIFGDLTDIPIGVPQDDCTWDFIKKILGSSWKILKPTGKFLTHGTGANNTKDLEAFETKIKETEADLEIEKSVAFIPSFYEHWVFYKIARK